MQVPDGLSAVDARDVAHGLLLALLQQHHGGSVLLDVAGLERAMGDAEGRMWSVVIEPVDPSEPVGALRVRVTVVKVSRDEHGAH